MLASLGISPNDMAQAASDPAAMQHIFSRIQAARPGSGSSSSERGGVELEGMIKNAEATFEREKLLPPGPAPPLSRPMFIQSLNEARRASEAREASTSPSSGHIRTTIVGIEKHVSHKDINDLKPSKLISKHEFAPDQSLFFVGSSFTLKHANSQSPYGKPSNF